MSEDHRKAVDSTSLDEGYENLASFYLEPEQIDALCEAQNECTFNWSTKDGWPVGVIMSYFRDSDTGKLWLTCARRRKRVPAVLRDNRVSVVVGSKGTKLGSQAVTFKGHCTVHTQDDQAAYDDLKKWFYPRLTAAAFPDRAGEPMVEAFEKLLDSPDRVILEVDVVKEITYDGNKMGKATQKAMSEERV